MENKNQRNVSSMLDGIFKEAAKTVVNGINNVKDGINKSSITVKINGRDISEEVKNTIIRTYDRASEVVTEMMCGCGCAKTAEPDPDFDKADDVLDTFSKGSWDFDKQGHCCGKCRCEEKGPAEAKVEMVENTGLAERMREFSKKADYDAKVHQAEVYVAGRYIHHVIDNIDKMVENGVAVVNGSKVYITNPNGYTEDAVKEALKHDSFTSVSVVKSKDGKKSSIVLGF